MTTTSEQLSAVLSGDAAADTLHDLGPADRRDRFLTLLGYYDLRADPAHPRARLANHPALTGLVHRLETEWLAELERLPAPPHPEDPVRALRAIAARDRLPPVYRWASRQASLTELVQFIALEGGPDGGFDDLVAVCQLGLRGAAKLELARNYWDEMGCGEAAEVHTELHADLVRALDLVPVAREEQPDAALERAALGGLLAGNRWLQPEMLGALGLIELQAGPRCTLVLQGLRRVGAPAGALPFYAVHAAVDPRHGRDWLEQAIGPTAREHPGWGPRMARGAAWRSAVNAAFFTALDPSGLASAA